MQNIHTIIEQVANLPDAQLQAYAQQNKSDPLVVAAALSESNRRKQMRAAAPPPNQQPPVVDQAISGISALPAPNMEGVGMAGGGIVAMAEGGDVPWYAYPQYSLPKMLGDVARRGVGWAMSGAPSQEEQDAIQREFIRRHQPSGPIETEPNMQGFTPEADPALAMSLDASQRSPAPASAATPGPGPKVAPKTNPGAIPPMVRDIGKAAGKPAAVADAFKAKTMEQTMQGIQEAMKGTMNKKALDDGRRQLESLAAEHERLLGKEDTVLGMSLLQAGLAMMASQSPHAMVGIGEGGLKGLQAYAQGHKDLRAERKELGKEERDVLREMAAERRAGLSAAVQINNQVRQEEGLAAQLGFNEHKLQSEEKQALDRNKTALQAAGISASQKAHAVPANIQMVERIAAAKGIPFDKALEYLSATQRQSEQLDERALRALHAKDDMAKLYKVPFEQWAVQNGYRIAGVPERVSAVAGAQVLPP